jgi:hypothetical protein
MGEHRWQPDQPSSWQEIVNDRGARVPEHTFTQPVPVTVRVAWAVDGPEYIDTVALGWSSSLVYVRIADRRCQTSVLWLDATDVQRR